MGKAIEEDREKKSWIRKKKCSQPHSTYYSQQLVISITFIYEEG